MNYCKRQNILFEKSERALYPRRKKKSNGFSLIELLVVMGIAAVLISVTVPATTSMQRRMNLTRAGTAVEQTLIRARQLALTSNRSMEVRFYKYADPQSPGGRELVRAMQIFKVKDNGQTEMVGKMNSLPNGIAINESSTLSPLIADASREKTFGTTSPKVDLPGLGMDYNATYLRFQPDSSTDLDPTGGTGGTWFLTLHAASADPTSTTPPPNYYTIQVDSLVGSVKTLRP